MGIEQGRKPRAIPLITGIVLLFAGILTMMTTIGEWGPDPGNLTIDWAFIPMFLLSGIILVFAFFIASGHRLADKAPYAITLSFILMIPFSYLGTPDTSGFYGSDRAWVLMMGFCQTFICGGISFIPMLLSGLNSEEVDLKQAL